MVSDAAIGQFKSKLRGQLLRPGDEGYETARKESPSKESLEQLFTTRGRQS
jgi:hypothetical protein